MFEMSAAIYNSVLLLYRSIVVKKVNDIKFLRGV